MKIVFIGGTGPVGAAAVAHALHRGHKVTVAHTGTHELTKSLDVRHLHGERDHLLAPDGEVVAAKPDVLVDTRTKANNAAALIASAGAAGVGRLVVVSSTDVYAHFVTGSGYDVVGRTWDGTAGRTALPPQTVPIEEDAPRLRGAEGL